MSIIYRNYSRRKFKEWKLKVKNHLPTFVTRFYQIKDHIDYEEHVNLGRVISAISNPAYGIIDEITRKHLDVNDEMAMQVLLELQVNELFAFINKRNKVTI